MRGGSLLHADEPEAFVRRRFDGNRLGGDAEDPGNVLPHGIRERRDLRLLEDDRDIHVHYRVPVLREYPGDLLQEDLA